MVNHGLYYLSIRYNLWFVYYFKNKLDNAEQEPAQLPYHDKRKKNLDYMEIRYIETAGAFCLNFKNEKVNGKPFLAQHSSSAISQFSRSAV